MYNIETDISNFSWVFFSRSLINALLRYTIFSNSSLKKQRTVTLCEGYSQSHWKFCAIKEQPDQFPFCAKPVIQPKCSHRETHESRPQVTKQPSSESCTSTERITSHSYGIEIVVPNFRFHKNTSASWSRSRRNCRQFVDTKFVFEKDRAVHWPSLVPRVSGIASQRAILEFQQVVGRVIRCIKTGLLCSAPRIDPKFSTLFEKPVWKEDIQLPSQDLLNRRWRKLSRVAPVIA